jgi:hypothetical protein
MMAAPLFFFAYLQINWNGKPVFVLKAFISLKQNKKIYSVNVTFNQWGAEFQQAQVILSLLFQNPKHQDL